MSYFHLITTLISFCDSNSKNLSCLSPFIQALQGHCYIIFLVSFESFLN